MDIEYLQQLRDNNIKYGTTMNFENRGIPLSEIQLLEQLYNSGNPFPKVLKELMFLAGDICYVCDYGPTESQQDLQEWKRETMQDYNRAFNRPFYIYSIYSDNFYFIFLDEGNNPTVYEANPSLEGSNWYRSLGNQTIQSIVNIGIDRVKKGQNPY